MMRWLLGTVATCSLAVSVLVLGKLFGLPEILTGHLCGGICAVGSTLSLGGKLWADD